MAKGYQGANRDIYSALVASTGMTKGVAIQFIRFGAVGTAGFFVDTAFVYALLGNFGLYGAGAIAYLAAVTTTWWLNRAWTFRGYGTEDGIHGQWVRFTLANVPGLVLNRGTYGLLVATSGLCASSPVLAVAAGSLAGMTTNFILSRALVFRVFASSTQKR